ncbi:MAG: radical SAM protein [Desulfobacteraceae bacterium]|nr:radical SAM protein [Desulfobacterales bacterium]MBL6967137.1 radical SAM protein [Desulfobacteraceae bacterium]MBL7102560.1 radical SAM protein [Desulfobacteraceae bacterium]MBL7172168.1 radical SAM protein [Desulfobacteraceae bacterium]
MHYEGPIYRPPSEADSLLVQATVGCPHNKCAFCMVYKKGPPFRVRPVDEIKRDLDEARGEYGPGIRTIFFPAGNTIAMPTDDLAAICAYAHDIFPHLERVTVYGSSTYIHRKGLAGLIKLKNAGLGRIHVGLESGDDRVLQSIKKGTDSQEQIEAGLWVLKSGIELSEYIMIGIGGKERTHEHAMNTALALNVIHPHFIRLRTFLPKANTLLLHQIRKGRFQALSPHEALRETREIIRNLEINSQVASDHYTNYVDIRGRMPEDRDSMLSTIEDALQMEEEMFRPVYVGTQ